jgi:hypothetical protein
MNYLLIQSDARGIPLRDKSVHCVVTSPPYWNLRSYLHDDDPLKSLEIGQEPTPEAYIRSLVVIFREVRRILRDDGCIFINLGDGYAQSEIRHRNGHGSTLRGGDIHPDEEWNSGTYQTGHRFDHGLKDKDLIGIPWACAFALRDDGWYLRADMPWYKKSPMPSSVTDRPGMAHEYVFLLAKRPNYYYDHVAVQRAAASTTVARDAYTRITSGKDGQYAVAHDHETPSGGVRNFRTTDFFRDGLDELIGQQEEYLAHLRKIRDQGGLLTDEDGEPLAFLVAAQGFPGAHFATMPPALVRDAIRAGSSEAGCCSKCQAPYERIVDHQSGATEASLRPKQTDGMNSRTSTLSLSGNGSKEWAERGGKIRTLGWCPTCRCNAGPPISCIIFDPFGGAGTVPMCAVQLGRRGIMTELSREYLEMARRRIERPETIRPRRKVSDGSMPLFAGLDGD